MSDTKERARFDAWWLGDYGPYGIRAEWPSSQTEAAWMAWKAQAEEIERLRINLKNIQRARVLQGKAIIDANNEIERLRVALQRVLSDIDFMVEGDLIPDIRNDFIYTEAHAALNPKGETE